MSFEGRFRPISELFNSEASKEVKYWEPLADLVNEFMHLRAQKDLTQAQVAARMETKQSVISRFENFGRKPNYDFLIRLAWAMGGELKISLSAQNPIASEESFIEETHSGMEDLFKDAVAYINDSTETSIADPPFQESIYESAV